MRIIYSVRDSTVSIGTRGHPVLIQTLAAALPAAQVEVPESPTMM